MRKIPLLFVLVLSLGASAQDTASAELLFKILPKQPKFYVTVHGGYSVALGSTFKFYPDDVKSITVKKMNNLPETKEVEYETTKKGLGEGVRIGAGFSYVINDFLNVGLDLDYFKSTIRKNRDSTYSGSNNNAPAGSPINSSFSERQTISYQTTLLTFVPNITFKAISRPNFFIYNKIGAVFTFRPNSLQKEITNGRQQATMQGGSAKDTSFSSVTKYNWGIKNPSFGFMGGIGIQTRLTDRIRGMAEVQFSHIVFRTRSRSLTSMVINGKETANELTVSQREIQFENDYEVSSNNSSNPNQPTRAVVQRFPISYVGLQVGLAYRF